MDKMYIVFVGLLWHYKTTQIAENCHFYTLCQSVTVWKYTFSPAKYNPENLWTYLVKNINGLEPKMYMVFERNPAKMFFLFE